MTWEMVGVFFTVILMAATLLCVFINASAELVARSIDKAVRALIIENRK